MSGRNGGGGGEEGKDKQVEWMRVRVNRVTGEVERGRPWM